MSSKLTDGESPYAFSFCHMYQLLMLKLYINVQLIFPSAMDSPGILMLQSVRKVFELAGIEPKSIQFQKDEFDASTVIDALTKDPKKCPVITTADFTDFFNDVFMGFSPARSSPPYNMHVMVTAGALKGSEFLPFENLNALF